MTQRDWQNLMRRFPAPSSCEQLVALVPQQFPPSQEQRDDEDE